MARSLKVKRLGLALIVIGMFIVIGTTVYRQTRAQQPQPPNPRVVELKSADGTLLKATYFAAGKPGPGVLLFHQNNRTRTSWDEVANQLAAAGIHTLTVDSRGHGESGGTRQYVKEKWGADDETGFQFLISQPGVQHDDIGVGGPGSDGVIHAVETASQHPNDVKSLVLISGETFRPGIEF